MGQSLELTGAALGLQYVILEPVENENSETVLLQSFSSGSVGKESTANGETLEAQVQSLGQEIPWRWKWQPTLLFFAGKSP